MKSPRASRSTAVGVAALLSVVFAFAAGCGFVFGGASKISAVKISQNHGLRGAGLDAQAPLHDDFAREASSWTAFVTMLFACGIVALLTSAPAVADIDMNGLLTPPPKIVINPDLDVEQVAVEARATYLQAKEDEKVLDKQARFEERMATRRIAEEKVKAEDIITANVKSEIDRVRAERDFAENAALEREAEAKVKAIAANQFAENYTQDKRNAKVVEISATGPKKQVLAKAVADRTRADEEARSRKEFADNALARLEQADKLASEKKLAVEKAVNDMAGIPKA